MPENTGRTREEYCSLQFACYMDCVVYAVLFVSA